MNLVELLNNDLNTALKNKDELTLSTLRLLMSAIKNKQIELKRKLSDEETLKIIANQAKQRRDSIEAYSKANRPDLKNREQAELDILNKYLPKQLSEQEIEIVVKEVIKELNATKADFGKVMGLAVKKLGGGASGQAISETVKKLLF